MVFYGIGIVCIGLFGVMRYKERSRTEKTAMLLLALSLFGTGLFTRHPQLAESNMVTRMGVMLQFLFFIAPLILGICSVGLLIHAISRLRERPLSRKYRVVALSGITMIFLTMLVWVNAQWLQNEWLYRLHDILNYLFVYLLGTFLIFLGIAGSSRVMNPSFEKAYIVVLGTGLTASEDVSRMLKYRLDKAIQFYQNQAAKHLEPATFLVTGGKSPGNSASEAEVMAKYLIQKGIPENKIIQENQSINTHQNFLYSWQLMDSKDKMVFVTSSYHVLRGNVYARQLGIGAVGIGAKSPLYYLPYALVREYLALFLIYRRFHLIALPFFIIMMDVFL